MPAVRISQSRFTRAIAQAKSEIFAGLTRDGVAIINADEHFATMWRVLAGSHTIIEFAVEAQAPVRAKTQVLDYTQLIDVQTPLGNFAAQLHAPGLHNVRNALAATAAAMRCRCRLR